MGISNTVMLAFLKKEIHICLSDVNILVGIAIQSEFEISEINKIIK